jgi:hypothetical protein
MYKMNYWCALALLGSLAGCPADQGDTDSDTDAATDGTGTTAATDSGTTAPTTTDEPTTGGVDVECDPKAQDCPEGLKCTAYAKVMQDTWDANKCVPETGEGVAGDPCDVEGGFATGIDNCAKGYICLNTDGEGMDGFCVEFCQPDEKSCPNTTDGTGVCNVINEGVLPICLATCDPVAQDCPGKQGCYGDPMMGPPFICFGPDPQNGGMDNNACAFTNDCLAGLHCIDAAVQDGCGADYCCTPFCPLDGDECNDPEECVAFFPEPFPGFENVGICVLPG